MKKLIIFILILSGALIAGQTLFAHRTDQATWVGRMHPGNWGSCHERTVSNDYSRNYMMEQDETRDWMDLQMIDRLIEHDLEGLNDEERLELLESIRDAILNELYSDDDNG